MNNPYQAPHGGVQPTTTIAAGGPTDRQFRIGAAIAVPVISLGMLLAFFVLRLPTIGGMVLVGLGWFAVFFGLAALVDPNIVRAAGKYGTHLSWHYKLVALLIGLAALACSLASSYFVLTR